MKTVTALHGQTLIDITIQELGDAERLFEVAMLNGKSITGSVTAGEAILVPDFDTKKKKLVKLFADPFNKPASNLGAGPTDGYWNFPSQVINSPYVPPGQKLIKPLPGQALIDIVIQELGDAERLFEVALLNNRGITDQLTTEDSILVPEYALDKKSIVKIFTEPFNKPASQKEYAEGEEPILEGIDYWAVNLDFIVS